MSDRIRVGVTGHRDLPADPGLERAVDAALDEIELLETDEGRAPVGLTAISALAEGADRMVAERILARGGGELEAVLPMPESEYRADFPTPRSRAEFGGLLRTARSVHRLPPSASRVEAYAAAGRYVVDHCDVLIAVWDGKPEGGPGGTAEIVRYARRMGREIRRIDPNEPGKEKSPADRAAPGRSRGPRVIRVFVSSTFRDMQAEREELAKFVFPRLRKMCEERRVVWGEVDLRWGITDEQKAETGVLPICLAEIDRCRPYFIGILGERYGWIPDDLPAGLIQTEPWLAGLRGRSVTELEILHGVLNDPAMAGHAFFYFRDPNYEVPEPGPDDARREADDSVRNLGDLKARIRRSPFPVREDYRSPRDLGELVFKDLALVIDRLFPLEDVPDPAENERREHEAFAEVRRRVYVGGGLAFERLDDHAQGDGPPLVIAGESGSGKSALLANWLRRFRERRGDVPVVAHFIGATAASAQWVAMTRRLIGEINRLCGRDEPVPYEPDELRRKFDRVLQMAGDAGRVVLIIDGLDELEDRDRAPDLLWLPLLIPASVRLILSTRQGRPLDETTARGWPTMPVEPLSPAERLVLLTDYLAQFRKTLGPTLAARVIAAPQASNPVCLRALAEELRLFGRHELLEQVLEAYLAAGGGVELFDKILERLERDYEGDRPGLVGRALGLIWASRRGLSEQELLDLLGPDGTPLPMAAWAPLSLALESHLISRSGLMAFSHEYVRQAVCRRYLPSGEDRRNRHARLADYFEARTWEERGFDEIPWQLERAGAWDRLYALLADLAFFRSAFKGNRYEVWEYWAAIEKNSTLRAIDAYRAVLSAPEANRDYVWSVASLLLMRGEADEASRLFEYLATNRIQGEDGQGRMELGRTLHNWSMALRAAGKLDAALVTSRQAESILRECGDWDTVGKALLCQGNLHKNLGQTDKALRLYEEAEGFSERADNRADLANSWASQGLALVLLRRYDDAAALLEKAKNAMRQLGNDDEARVVLSSQAVVAWKRGDLDLALSLYREEERTCRKYGEKKPLASCLMLQAFVLVEKEDRSAAIGPLREALGLFAETGDFAQANACWRMLGDALEQVGDDPGALAAFEEAERTLGGAGRGTELEFVLDRQARLLSRMGRIEESLVRYRRAADLLRQAGDQKKLATNLYCQGIVLLNGKRDMEALTAFRAAGRMSRRLDLRRVLADTVDQQAYILRRAGRLGPALALSRAAERLYRALDAADGLIKCLHEQAVILKTCDRYGESLDCLVEMERLCRDTDDRRGLVDSLAKQASLLLTFMSRPDEARTRAEEALGLCPAIGDEGKVAFLEGILRQIPKA